jgi:hypothetical protein
MRGGVRENILAHALTCASRTFIVTGMHLLMLIPHLSNCLSAITDSSLTSVHWSTPVTLTLHHHLY